MTQAYIGVKQVTAWPEENNGSPGYQVKYPDGHQIWQPKQLFESTYFAQGNDPTTINQKMVDAFIASVETIDFDDKTTLVKATLLSGFTIIEYSSCVDFANYDQAVGEAICYERIKNKIWEHLGFVLQWAKDGI
jgi:Phage protein (N4 Gp49/phage Sf6 gene 66) family